MGEKALFRDREVRRERMAVVRIVHGLRLFLFGEEIPEAAKRARFGGFFCEASSVGKPDHGNRHYLLRDNAVRNPSGIILKTLKHGLQISPNSNSGSIGTIH
ncbi:MAG: hypothetical protein QMC36_01950 [Patescibacteria group bacterium]